MAILATFPAANAPSDTTVPVSRNIGQGVKEAAPPQGPAQYLRVPSSGSAKQAGKPHIAQTRATIAFDLVINQLVGEIVDEETGEEIVALPPKGLMALYTKMHEQLGPLVDEKP